MIKSVVSHGIYIPFLRITREEYINTLGSCNADIKEKAVMDIDEDVLTMAVEAARNASTEIDISQIGVLTLASATFPYAERVMTGTIIQALGLNKNILTSQHGNSTLAGTEAFLSALGLMEETEAKYALVIISDAPAAEASSDMDHGFGAAACAFVLAKAEPGLRFEGTYAYSDEVPGLRYRLPGDKGVRDIGVRSYSAMAHDDTMQASVQELFNKMHRTPGDYQHVVLHQTSQKTAGALAKKLGFSDGQIKIGLVYDQFGDTGSCSPFIGLCHVLENAGKGAKIMICSYSPGSGSHALSFDYDNQFPDSSKKLQYFLNHKKYISYIHYLKIKKVI